MGTRHLIAVQKDNEYKFAQYGHWDGYPEGVGSDLLGVLQKITPEELAEKIKRCKPFNAPEYFADYGIPMTAFDENGDIDRRNLSAEEADKYTDIYNRYKPSEVDAYAIDAITSLAEAKDNVLGDFYYYDSLKFAGDSLFCEWAYIIDLDKNTLEVYKGFNQEPLAEGDRFYPLQQEMFEGSLLKKQPETNIYYPVKLEATFDLQDLPDPDVFVDRIYNGGLSRTLDI